MTRLLSSSIDMGDLGDDCAGGVIEVNVPEIGTLRDTVADEVAA